MSVTPFSLGCPSVLIMAEGKWISDLKASTPITDAARHVLTVRLEVVRDYLPLAVKEPERDPEYIHQLRVGTRRASAALDIFAICLPERSYDLARKQLRRVRRNAGAARDWDVFLLALDEWVKKSRKPSPGTDLLMGYAFAQRIQAQLSLREAVEGFPFSFDRLLAETVAAVHRPRVRRPYPRTLVDLACPLLTGLLQDVDNAVARDLEDYENLHQVRIAGKRLRYAMEVFGDCFAPPFREKLYPAVEEMQEILGRANDSHVAARRLRSLREDLRAMLPRRWKRYRASIEKLLQFHEQRLPEERESFLLWWENWQQSGTEATLLNLLKGPEVAAS